jgi:hypothetical protein
VSKFHLNLLVQFSKVMLNSKNQLKFEKNFFLNFGPSPAFSPVVAHLPSPQHRPTCQLAHTAFPSSPSLTCGPCPHLTPSVKPAEHRRALLGHRPPPAPWQEADPPSPLPLPLLYWPPSSPPLPVTDAHRHQWRRLHFTVVRSPPSPSAPIKGAPAVPHLTAPHTTLLSPSLMLELTPATNLQSPLLCHRHPAASPLLSLR